MFFLTFQNGVPQHPRSKQLRVQPQQIRREEPSVRAPHGRGSGSIGEAPVRGRFESSDAVVNVERADPPREQLQIPLTVALLFHFFDRIKERNKERREHEFFLFGNPSRPREARKEIGK